MKRIAFYKTDGLNEYELDGIGIQWTSGREAPPMTIFREPQDY